MTKLNAMQPLYKRIQKLGYTIPQIKKVLPDWWDDNLANTPAGIQEATLILAKRFNVQYSSLLTDTPISQLPIHRFKHSQSIQTEQLTKAVTFSTLASQIIHKGYTKPLAEFQGFTAHSIRERILENEPWVDFNSLVEFCWDIGIPVVFIEKMPSPKMQGLALQEDDRPTIILTSKRKNGWLVFDLAHELGHIVLGHIDDETWVIDEKIDKNDTKDEEQQANQFAIELLTGKSGITFNDLKLSPKKLADAILSHGRNHSIDPLHLLLNYGYSTDKIPFALKAMPHLLKDLAITQTDQEICRTMLFRNIDVSLLDDENALRYLIGVDK